MKRIESVEVTYKNSGCIENFVHTIVGNKHLYSHRILIGECSLFDVLTESEFASHLHLFQGVNDSNIVLSIA